MKRLRYLLVALVTLSCVVMPAIQAAAATNLISNPSVEDGTGTAPATWTTDKWGTNTAVFSRPADAKDGAKSVKAELTARTSGDVKWMHAPVTVVSGKSYNYKSAYKANVATQLMVRYTTAAGVESFVSLKSVPAAATAWTDLTATFTAPANVAKAQVIQVLALKGWVQGDAFSLEEVGATTPPVTPPTDPGTPTNPPIPPSTTNLIANPSFETATGTTPANWTSNKWGTNTSAFTYETTGRTGTKSVKVNTTAYTSGDAKWMAAPVNITAGKNYTYSDYYKATKATKVILAYQNAAGAFTYVTLANAPIAANWTQYSASFVVPANMTKVSVYHLVDSVTALTVDDVSLTETTTTTPPVEPPVEPPVTPPTDEENLIANPSMETANGTVPANWTSNNWGTNTTSFTYNTTGRTGKSVTTTTTAYTNGDAKWFAAPVNVTAGKNYLYREYYKSTIPTQVLAAYQDAAGTYTYAELPAAAIAANWVQYSASFTVPAGVTKVSIYHVLAGVGSLSLDDTELHIANPNPTEPTTTVPNGSVETGTTTPTNWNSSGWGANTPTYQYVTNEGHTGTKSLKVTVANYTDGDAKWYFDPIKTLQPGKQYRFTNWFKGTATPHVVALYIDAAGVEKYVGLPSPQAISSTAWTKYSDTFTVPEGTVAASVFMYVNQNGWLQTDDYSIADYHPNGFNRALVTLTFDDGHEDNRTTALPLLNQLGFKTTQCYATQFLEGQPQAVIDGAMAFANSGHEICSHTVTHPQLTTKNDADLQYELQHSKQYLEQMLAANNAAQRTVLNFASPYGDYDARVNGVIDNYYQSHRTVDEGFNSKDNFDKYRLRVQNILDTTTAAQVQEWVEQAQADKTWLVLVYHRVASNPGPYDTTPALFTAQMNAIKNSGIKVSTYQEALTEVQGQL